MDGNNNFFHYAVRNHDRKALVKNAVRKLPKRDVQVLLSEQSALRKWNPFHVCAFWGSLETLQLMLSVYRSGFGVVEDPPGGKPWLARANDGRTPLHLFLEYNDEEECALELLSMDMELLCVMVDNKGYSPLYHAVNRGFNRFALKILKSNCSYSVSGQDGFNPIHVSNRCSEEVWTVLYKKYPDFLYLTIEDKTSVLHEWAKLGTLRPLLLLEKTISINTLQNLSRLPNDVGDNPLHVAVKHDNQEFAYFLVEICGIRSDTPLWLCKNYTGITPLDLALDKCWESLVLRFISNFSWSHKEPIRCLNRRLIVAATKKMRLVVEMLCSYADLEMIVVDFLSDSTATDRSYRAQAILYILSHCADEIYWRMMHRKHPEIVHVTGENGNTMLHAWARKGELWPILLLEEVDINSLQRLSHLANNDGDIPLHIAVKHDHEAFALRLVKKCRVLDLPQWQFENADGIMPFDMALHQHLENLVLHFISKDYWIHRERSNKGESRLFTAIEKGMDQIVQAICSHVAADSAPSTVVPTENRDGRTILYVLSNCTETTAKLVFKTFPHLINKPDQNGRRPIDIASEFGVGWLTKLLITTDPSSIAISPNVWIELCKRGHLEAIEAFIIHYDDFRQLCIEQEDSPLHRIKLTTYQEYEKLLSIPLIWEMKNRRDYDGKTPLHRALERKDILFAELLLHKGVNRSIRDRRRKTATKLLSELCDQYYEWEEMAQRVGINPRLRNLGSSAGEMRTTLSVVAALLATLTFAAAFTVPGGFNQDTGEIILVRKASFLVFILADTYAMCCAMFVLFCLIWSMVCDQDESQLLIDRSVLVLIQSFYGTLMAFMTGVYTVVHHKSLWAAILICVMCSLVGISTNRSILFRVLDKLDRKEEARSKNKIWEQVEVKLTGRKGFLTKRVTAREDHSERSDPLANV